MKPEKKTRILKALADSLDVEAVLKAECVNRNALQALLREASRAYEVSSVNSPGVNSPGALMIYIDGASRGNPGLSAAGVVIHNTAGKILAEKSIYLGEGTNNSAEYQALLHALEAAREMGAGYITIHSDSELVVNQLKGTYKVKQLHLQHYYFKAINLFGHFKDVRLVHVPREKNRQADMLANRALDEYISSGGK